MPRTPLPRTAKIAEGLVEVACQAGGAAVNRAHDDQFGWDLLVQLPGIRRAGPADLDLPGLTALVQVKSTTTRARSCKLKLSNALRLAKEPVPCFIAFLVFDRGATQPREVFLRHIWSEEIHAALLGARVAHNAGEEDLHRVGHRMNFSEPHRCQLQDIPDLLQRFASAEGRDYSAKKAKLVQTVGYEGGYGTGRFSLGASTSPDDFVDLMLGRIPELPVETFEIDDTRFGLPGPKVVEASSARLSVTVEPKDKCQVIFRSADGGRELALDGDVYIPGIPDLPDEHFRLRLQTRLAEFIIQPRRPRSSMNLGLDADAPMPIADLADMATLLDMAASGPLDLGVWVKGGRISHATVEFPPAQVAPPWGRLSRALQRLFEILPTPRWPAEARFTVRDMFDGLDSVEKVAGQVSTKGIELVVGAINPESLAGLLACKLYLAPVFLDFGDATFFVVVEAPIETAMQRDEQAVVKLGKPKILRRAMLPGGLANNLPHFQELLASARSDRMGPDLLHGALTDLPVADAQ